MLTYSELYDLERKKNLALSKSMELLVQRYESIVANYLEGTDAFGTYLVEIHGFKQVLKDNTTGMKDYEDNGHSTEG